MVRCLRLAAACSLLVWFGAAASTPSVTTCEEANPFDTLPDDAALQACLDNYDRVLLKPSRLPGYVGYLVANRLKIRRSGILLTSADIPNKATILADPSLSELMLRASGSDGYEISFIRFDGNREDRAVRDKPCTTIHDYRNVELSGSGFHVRYVESTRAVCGSGMTIGGANRFEVYGSWFYDNGRQQEDANGVTGLWADGLNVFGCDFCAVRDNDFWDNTDVDLGVNGGTSCAVYRNVIHHGSAYAFAGLVAGDPSRSGGEYSDNHVSSDYDLLGFGIIVGCHPWSQCKGGYASDVWVHRNSAVGAVVNLAVDGLNGGRIEDNSMSGAQGTRGLNCDVPADYTAGHMINARLQSGFVVRTYDFGSGCR